LDRRVAAVNLFAYGTLLDKRIMFKVIGRSLPTPVPATLLGYRKWETTLGYPVVLPEVGATCSGYVFFSLTPQDWKRLDEYENTTGNPPAYFRKLVGVQGAYGSINANVYIGHLNYFRARLKL
jgi:gamma-glutamylcyclotransferase (GGCT)/AIG2-like uncharacterized protein YtfP